MAQPQGVELVDCKYPDAALRASDAACEPLSTAARSIYQGRIHDLHQLRVAPWKWLQLHHRSQVLFPKILHGLIAMDLCRCVGEPVLAHGVGRGIEQNAGL